MRLSARPLALIAVCGLAMLCTACGSNNKGKIVGKWKATSFPGMDETAKANLKKMGDDAFSLVIEFKPDGKMVGTMTINMLGKSQTEQVMSADYALGKGDWVNFTNMNPPQEGKSQSKDKVVIQGDTMTLETEKGEKITLTRMK